MAENHPTTKPLSRCAGCGAEFRVNRDHLFYCCWECYRKHHKPKLIHGGTGLPEFGIWNGIKARCLMPTKTGYENYGGRGITVCDEWRRDFTAFYAHVGPRPSPHHSIDRIDNSKGYEPGNVRWATRIEQARNTRASHYIEYNGIRATIAEWAERVGINRTTLAGRLRNGWAVARALNTPPWIMRHPVYKDGKISPEWLESRRQEKNASHRERYREMIAVVDREELRRKWREAKRRAKPTDQVGEELAIRREIGSEDR